MPEHTSFAALATLPIDPTAFHVWTFAGGARTVAFRDLNHARHVMPKLAKTSVRPRRHASAAA